MWHGKVIRQLVADMLPGAGYSTETRRMMLSEIVPLVELHLGGMHGLMRFLVLQLACLFNLCAILVVGKPYHMAGDQARQRYLSKVQGGSFGPFKDLIKLVHSLTLLHYYSRSDILQDMGFPVHSAQMSS